MIGKDNLNNNFREIHQTNSIEDYTLPKTISKKIINLENIYKEMG